MPSLDSGISTRKQLTGKAWWRSLDELADSAEFRDAMQREFPEVATEAIGPQSRRSFLKYMGASLALAGLTMTGCRMPKEKIAPFAYRPPGTSPGVPRQFATALDHGGYASGMLVTSFDGRPVKIEGNPLHPASLGAASAIGQACVLDVYDPDRSMHCINRSAGDGEKSDWDQFAAWAADHFKQLKGTGGVGLSVLSEASSSPTFADMRQRFGALYPQAKWHEYEPVSRDNERLGTQLVFGRPVRPQYRLDQAGVILALDADFLHTHPNALAYAREFAKGRRGTNLRMNKLFCVESSYSVTGTMADERLALASSRIPVFAAALAQQLFNRQHIPEPAEAAAVVSGVAGFRVEPDQQPALEKIAAALSGSSGHCLVVAGENQPPAVHALAVLLNEALGNNGETVTYTEDINPYRASHAGSIQDLVADLNGGSVNMLVILGGNPVYNAPVDLDFAAALGKAGASIHLSHADDETSKRCTWHLNRAHFLETWGDARAWDGTYGVIQPLIEPLYGGRSPAELLALLSADQIQSGHNLVQRVFPTLAGDGARWDKVLHDGLLQGSGLEPVNVQRDYARLGDEIGKIAQAGSGFELTFSADARLFDGRYAGNGWLQEMPEPLTKMAWDNALLIGIADAEAQGVKHGDLLQVEAGGRSLELPAYVMPGQAAGSLAVALGYGRDYGSRVADGIGFNTYKLRTSVGLNVASGVSLRRTGRKYDIVSTQDHHLIDEVGFKERERRVGDLVREGTLSEYEHHPEFAKHKVHHPPLQSMWTEHQYTDYKWGMTIDLSACNGCGACIVACQAENNIPVVGRQRVSEGREMHWIRVDRYFQGEPESARVANQPVTCHHCEMAPCEQVCPVAATVHTDEGLNDMVYNRCVGTRYCSNNCPYKVRRFNYFNYRKQMTETEKLLQNPEVTVRSRGVMEKCSFCVQRIQAAKITARNEGRRVGPDEVVPACAQTCPAQAITFGDLNQLDSQVYLQTESDRAYQMLSELNVKPRISYLAKLRNTDTASSHVGLGNGQTSDNHTEEQH